MPNNQDWDFEFLRQHSERSGFFLIIIIRMEFALKELEYFSRENGIVRVCYKRFAREKMGADFYQRIVANNIANTLIHHPPRQQRIRERALTWEDQAAPLGNVEELFGAIWTVRNNLFHGGKENNQNPNRNEGLVSESLSVLREVIMHEDLSPYFQ